MMSIKETTIPVNSENIAQTLTRELPKPQVLHTQSLEAEDDAVIHLAMPNGFKHITVDNEVLRDHPRRTEASAVLTEPDDFIAYVDRHANPSSVIWTKFDPTTYSLEFTSVIDEHGRDTAGWRRHKAHYKPQMSIEWNTWVKNDKEAMTQVEFAAFLESQEDDIAHVDGRPTHLEMMKMALEFEARQDQKIKSAVRLQNGGIEMSYIGNDDAETIEKMKVFDKFTIGIPAFRGVKDELGKPLGYLIDARLRYRTGQGKVVFWYELIRADKTHELAATTLIRRIQDGVGEVPMFMGSCG
jgi:uncharacterized protein YfdQ (DUF2303 family)